MLQTDFNTNYPQLNIQILGMNQTTHQGGNPSITAGRDIPWLQDEDKDQNGSSDVWLNSWPFAYRDVVIVDEDNLVVDTFNLTTHDLAVAGNYAALRQLFLDAAIPLVEIQDDVAQVSPGMSIDIPLLKNDGLSNTSPWAVTSVVAPSAGSAQILTISYPADLDPSESNGTSLVLSEVRPGEYVELFNTSYNELALNVVTQQLVVGAQHVAIAQLGAGQTVAPRGYVQLPWPAAFLANSAGGEVLLYRQPASEFTDPLRIDGFIAWGAPPAVSHRVLAMAANRWVGDPAPALAQGSIHRRPSSHGVFANDFDTQHVGTPAEAFQAATTTVQVVRYTASLEAAGEIAFDYTVSDGNLTTGTAAIRITVSPQARPWRNPLNHLDVDGDGNLAPRDALLIINYLNRGLQGALNPERTGARATLPYLDSNGNNSSEPADLLVVVNALNNASAGEGESRGGSHRPLESRETGVAAEGTISTELTLQSGLVWLSSPTTMAWQAERNPRSADRFPPIGQHELPHLANTTSDRRSAWDRRTVDRPLWKAESLDALFAEAGQLPEAQFERTLFDR